MFTNSRAIDDRATAASFDTAYQKYAAATDSWFDGSPFSVDNRLAQCRRLMNLTRAHVARRGAEAGPLNRLAELETDARALVALREDLLTGGFDREDISRIAGVYVAAGPLKEEHDGMAPWEAADEEKGATKLAADDIYFDPHGEYAEEPDWPTAEDWKGFLKAKAEAERRKKRESSLSPQDRRFVTLESSRFLADNIDTNDARELATRAMHLAQKATSAFDVNRSRAVTAAFVERVAAGAYERQRIASAVPKPSVRTASVDSLPPEALFF